MTKKKMIYTIAAITFLIDFFLKRLVIAKINISESIEVVKDFFYFTRVENNGAAFGILDGKVFIFILIAFFFLIYLFKMIKEEKLLTKLEVAGYGLLIGGIVGNFYDRVLYGAVIDFINVYIFNYDFPVFNIADSAIIIGTFLLIISIFQKEK